MIKDNSNQTFLKYWKRIIITLPTIRDGLKHTNYNSDIRKYTKETDPITQLLKLKILPPTDGKPLEYKYKFQGQERQDELGLNWDSFKWRNYDYAIGRFMNIDPLTEEYHTWSPYVFSGNRVIDARELEGLEPHSVHKTLDEAAINFVSQYNGLPQAPQSLHSSNAPQMSPDFAENILFIAALFHNRIRIQFTSQRNLY